MQKKKDKQCLTLRKNSQNRNDILFTQFTFKIYSISRRLKHFIFEKKLNFSVKTAELVDLNLLILIISINDTSCLLLNRYSHTWLPARFLEQFPNRNGQNILHILFI